MIVFIGTEAIIVFIAGAATDAIVSAIIAGAFTLSNTVVTWLLIRGRRNGS